MDADSESPTEGSRSPSQAPLILEVRLTGLPDSWEVLRADSPSPLLSGKTAWEASDEAINYLSGTCGGEVIQRSPEDRIVGRESIPRTLSREEIIESARSACERESVALVTPETAVEIDVPDDLEFAAALWRFCSESREARWKEADLGFAFQHGPYVLWNRDSGRFALEEFETTAAAMRRFDRIRLDDLAQTRTGLLVVDGLMVAGLDIGEFALKPGDLLKRSGKGRFIKIGPGWIEVVRLSPEQAAAQRPVLILSRDLDHFLLSPSDAALFEELTGEKFIKYLTS